MPEQLFKMSVKSHYVLRKNNLDNCVSKSPRSDKLIIRQVVCIEKEKKNS